MVILIHIKKYHKLITFCNNTKIDSKKTALHKKILTSDIQISYSWEKSPVFLPVS